MINKKWIEEKIIESSDCNTQRGEKDFSCPKMHILINQLVFIRMYKLV